MITKYIFGHPFETEAVIEAVETKTGCPTVGTFDFTDGFCFTCPLEKGDRVYGLGGANRGINKRGYVYESN